MVVTSSADDTSDRLLSGAEILKMVTDSSGFPKSHPDDTRVNCTFCWGAITTLDLCWFQHKMLNPTCTGIAPTPVVEMDGQPGYFCGACCQVVRIDRLTPRIHPKCRKLMELLSCEVVERHAEPPPPPFLSTAPRTAASDAKTAAGQNVSAPGPSMDHRCDTCASSFPTDVALRSHISGASHRERVAALVNVAPRGSGRSEHAAGPNATKPNAAVGTGHPPLEQRYLAPPSLSQASPQGAPVTFMANLPGVFSSAANAAVPPPRKANKKGSIVAQVAAVPLASVPVPKNVPPRVGYLQPPTAITSAAAGGGGSKRSRTPSPPSRSTRPDL